MHNYPSNNLFPYSRYALFASLGIFMLYTFAGFLLQEFLMSLDLLKSQAFPLAQVIGQIAFIFAPHSLQRQMRLHGDIIISRSLIQQTEHVPEFSSLLPLPANPSSSMLTPLRGYFPPSLTCQLVKSKK